MAIQTLVGIPDKFNVGDTVLFTEQFTDYPVADWTAKLWLNIWSGTPTSITATTSGSSFLFTISNTVSAAIPPGTYEFSIVVTNGTQTATPKVGTISALPNFAVAQTASFAQAQVARLETALAALTATTNSSVSFNGQSYSKADINTYNSLLTYWKAQVIAEQNRINTLRGKGNQPLVSIRFTPQLGSQWPWSWPYTDQNR